MLPTGWEGGLAAGGVQYVLARVLSLAGPSSLGEQLRMLLSPSSSSLYLAMHQLVMLVAGALMLEWS